MKFATALLAAALTFPSLAHADPAPLEPGCATIAQVVEIAERKGDKHSATWEAFVDEEGANMLKAFDGMTGVRPEGSGIYAMTITDDDEVMISIIAKNGGSVCHVFALTKANYAKLKQLAFGAAS